MTTQRRRRRKEPQEQEKDERGQLGRAIQVPIRWEGMDELPVLMANQIFVRYIDGQIIITFGQGIPPYEIQVQKETIERLQREGAPVRAVARVAVSPSSLGRMIGALSEMHGRLDKLVADEAAVEIEEVS